MQQKTLLLASFLKAEQLDIFLEKIKNKYGVKKENVFFFKTENTDYLLTYKVTIDIEHKLDIKHELPKTIQVHKKGDTFFTINALNKLIERESGLGGNVNHKEYKINWEEFKNQIILLKTSTLEITNIERVFLA